MILRLPYLLLFFIFVCLFVMGLSLGPMEISLKDIVFLDFLSSSHEQVFWSVRFPEVITAILAGASIAISGLLMQAYFQNPLAGPYMLGIHSGASLLVAFWTIGISIFPVFSSTFFIKSGEVIFSIIGSLLTLVLLISMSKLFRSKLLLIIFGLIISYFSSSLVSLLISFGKATDIKAFLLWGFGSFKNSSGEDLIILSLVVLPLLFLSLFLAKPLNAITQGEDFARVSGLNVERFERIIILIAGILTGVVTSYCGPIAFIGIIAPHICRMLFKTSNHNILIPVTILFGSTLALTGEILSGGNLFAISFPLNSALGILGAPIIFLFLWKGPMRGFF